MWSVSPTGVLICCTVPSEAVPFVCLASVCRSLQCLISTLTQAGGGGLLFRLLVPSRCGEGRRCFPAYAAQAPGCSVWSCPALRAAPALGCSTRARNKQLRLLFASCLSRQSGSGSQGLDGRSLPGAFCPQPQSPPAPVGCLGPVSRLDPPGGCRPSRISGGLRLETGGLFAVRQGLRSSGPSLPLSPPPCLQPLAGLGWSAACELFSGLAWSLCSANGRQCFQAG